MAITEDDWHKTQSKQASKYDDYHLCQLCKEVNSLNIKDSINHDICETETTCTKCGHKGYWAYGFYESNKP